MLWKIFLIIAAAVVLVKATEVKKCVNGKGLNDVTVSITNCEKPPCKLKRKTEVGIEERFTPSRDIGRLQTSVHATILGIPLPFIGVDGTDACNNIYDSTGEKKIKCPLSAGTEYIYKNKFPILPLYPKVALVVYWALVEKGEPVTCFEVDSKITG